jgi:hypothetical protein
LPGIPDCPANNALPYCPSHAVMDKETGSVKTAAMDDCCFRMKHWTPKLPAQAGPP